MSKRSYKKVFGEENDKGQHKFSKETSEEKECSEELQEESLTDLDLDDLDRKIDAALQEECRRMDEKGNIMDISNSEDISDIQNIDEEELNQRLDEVLENQRLEYFLKRKIIIIQN